MLNVLFSGFLRQLGIKLNRHQNEIKFIIHEMIPCKAIDAFADLEEDFEDFPQEPSFTKPEKKSVEVEIQDFLRSEIGLTVTILALIIAFSAILNLILIITLVKKRQGKKEMTIDMNMIAMRDANDDRQDTDRNEDTNDGEENNAGQAGEKKQDGQ